MTADASVGPRSGLVQAALGPEGWREPMVWLVAGGWVAFALWIAVTVIPASSQFNSFGVWGLVTSASIFDVWGRQAWPNSERSAPPWTRARIALGVLLLVWLVGTGYLIDTAWESTVTRLSASVPVLGFFVHRHWAEVQRRRSLPPVDTPSLADDPFIQRMRHDR